MAAPVAAGAGAAASGLSLPVAATMLGGVGLAAIIAFILYNSLKESKPGEKREMTVKTPHGETSITLENNGRVIEFTGGKDCKLSCNDNVLRDPQAAEELRKTLQAFAALVAIQAGGLAISHTLCADTGRVIMGATYQMNGESHQIKDIAEFFGPTFSGNAQKPSGETA